MARANATFTHGAETNRADTSGIKPRPPSRISKLDEFERPYVGESGASYLSTLPSWMLKVEVEDYNYAHKNRYAKRTGLAANRFRYIIL